MHVKLMREEVDNLNSEVKDLKA